MADVDVTVRVKPSDAIAPHVGSLGDFVVIGDVYIFVSDSDTAAKVAGAFSDLAELMLERERDGG